MNLDRSFIKKRLQQTAALKQRKPIDIKSLNRIVETAGIFTDVAIPLSLKYLLKKRSIDDKIKYDYDVVYDTVELSEADFNKRLSYYRSKYQWLPVAFKVTYHGGWLTPKGRMWANVIQDYDSFTLGKTGIQWDQKSWRSILDQAYSEGYIRIGYYQTYGGSRITFSPFIRREIILKMCPNALSESNMRRVLALVRFYEAFFKGNVTFRVIELEVEDTGLDSNGLPTMEKSVRGVDEASNRLLHSSLAVQVELIRIRGNG